MITPPYDHAGRPVSVLNGYPAYTQATMAANQRAFQQAGSPGPLEQLYANDMQLAGFGQPTSPQPQAFPNLTVSTALRLYKILQ